MRKEHDFLGEIEVPDEAYYGVQTMRAIENFTITGRRLDEDFIKSLAKVKKAAAQANMETGRLDRKIGNALVQAAEEIIDGQFIDQFPVDPIQARSKSSARQKAATTSSARTTTRTWRNRPTTACRRPLKFA